MEITLLGKMEKLFFPTLKRKASDVAVFADSAAAASLHTDRGVVV